MVDLTLYLVTFNCARNLVEPEVLGRHLFHGWSNPGSESNELPDVVVLHLQEIAPIAFAFLGNNWVKPYFDQLRKAVNVAVQNSSSEVVPNDNKYLNILAKNAGLTAMMIFTRADVAQEVQLLQTAEAGVGLSEMANKGAVGARLGWKTPQGGSLVYTTFVSAHLAPFEAEMQRRDQDYRQIVQQLVFSGEDAREWRKTQQGAEEVPLLAGSDTEAEADEAETKGIYADDTYLFFAGDLNYRTALTLPGPDDHQHFPQPRKNVTDPLHYSHLFEKDQLSQQRNLGKTLHGLSEQAINFPPTYKYRPVPDKPVLLDDDLDDWNWAKHRWPSWCDRILYAPTNVRAGSYSALPILRTSDHRPVALSASIPLQTISDSQLAESTPAVINPHYKSVRLAARRKEVAVGVAAYLGLTWEGNYLLLGAVLMLVGVQFMVKAMT